jgi:assimilatory nitrate reductase catalytic subunit
VELAGATALEDWPGFARRVLGAAHADLLASHDSARGAHRFAAFAADRFLGALFVAPQPVALARDWLAARLGETRPALADRLGLLAGRGGADTPDNGPVLCACYGVGRNRIAAAIAAGADSVAAVGAATSAGTNCGSCRADIAGLLHASSLARAG